jgi:hypothetical protein
VVFHDYLRGMYIRRSTRESFCQVFDACSAKLVSKPVRENYTLKISSYSAFEPDWMEDLLSQILACNSDWKVSIESESSGSHLTIEDLVDKYLVIS